ncbi:ankyrin [Epithele typhae]|uniref:ankyrin n=1 Tax=Epithele typhae TaxID=378194 RepID=UPI0020076DA8|nr:ankyrin [Epithele typhae]KAH9945271.1 ankyrin [Epithele typhae]
MSTHPRARRRTERAALDAALLDAAAHADAAGVRAALERDADVNVTDDATGHTAVTCAIAGDSAWEEVDVSDASFALPRRLDVLRTLLRSETMSLYALNAPARGVTPLGLAAWLNVPDMVRVLLEESRGLVAVDGTDSLGVTPLMYAARDGVVEVASLLLSHGARPDIRDTHHRTAVYYALRHPKLLWLCEASMRKQRLREYFNGNKRQLHNLPHPHSAYAQSFVSSPVDSSHWPVPSESVLPKSTTALANAVIAGDLSAVHQILFPPSHRPSVQVNRLDQQGWAPIHYCVCSMNPSVEILDALFLAGADTSLYTTSKHGTPLHDLARQAPEPSSPFNAARLHVFIHHLVRELRAPLAATDENDETCLHVAAEHGQSMDVLLALLACDSHNTVRQMKNARGLTPLDVARPELRMAFGPEAEPARSNSVASFRTIRPSTTSSTSTSSFLSLMAVPQSTSHRPPSRMDMSPLGDVDPHMLARRILENLTMVTQESAAATSLEAAGLRDMLEESSHLGQLWVQSMQARIQDAACDLRDARSRFKEVDSLLQSTTSDLEHAFGTLFSDHRDSTDRARRRTVDSDSTAVSSSGSSLGRKTRSMSDLRSSSESVKKVPGELPSLTISEEDEFPSGPASAIELPMDKPSSFFNALLSPVPRELLHKPSEQSFDSARTASPGQYKKDGAASGTAKLKAWFRKKLRFELPDLLNETKIVAPGEQSPRASPFSPAREKQAVAAAASSADADLAVARQVVQIVCSDLSRIEGGMNDADQLLALASNLLSQTDRRLKAIIVNRRNILENSRLCELDDSEDPMLAALSTPTRPVNHDCVPFPMTRSRADSGSDGSLLSPSSSPPISAGSSMISLADTLIDSDDDDLRTIRRLLTRRVEARTDGAFDEVEKAMSWLRIVQDTLRTLRRTQAASLPLVLAQ